ncbi:MAG: CapA family protein [Firmicutes bacterium]|nr:CapA family protein [Bacillota bacterium]
MIRFAAAGDMIQLRRLPEGDAGAEKIKAFMAPAEVRLVNLETPIVTRPCWCSTFSGAPPLAAKPYVIDAMKYFGFQACGCANNHTLDFGLDGLLQTLENLDLAGMAHAGIGRSLFDATLPAAVPAADGDVAYIAASAVYYENDTSRAGEPHDGIPARPGLNGLRHIEEYLVTPAEMEILKDLAARTLVNAENEVEIAAGYMADAGTGDCFDFGPLHFRIADKTGKISRVNETDMRRIERAVRNAKRTHAYCVVSLHSHQFRAREEYETDYYVEEFAHRVIDAGADVFLGTGTHMPKAIEIYQGKPIFYCLGNFIFQGGFCNERVSADFIETLGFPPDLSGPEVYAKQNQKATNSLDDGDIYFRAIVPRWEMEDGQVTKIELLPIDMNRTAPLGWRGFPSPAAPETMLAHMELVSAGYGTKYEIRDGLIEVNW